MNETCPQHGSIESGIHSLFAKVDALTAATAENTACIREMTVSVSNMSSSLKPLLGNGKAPIDARVMLLEQRLDEQRQEADRSRGARLGALWNVAAGIVIGLLTMGGLAMLAAIALLWRTGLGGP